MSDQTESGVTEQNFSRHEDSKCNGEMTNLDDEPNASPDYSPNFWMGGHTLIYGGKKIVEVVQ